MVTITIRIPSAAVTLHANAHGVILKATNHNKVEFYTELHQHETDGIQSTEATNVYQCAML